MKLKNRVCSRLAIMPKFMSAAPTSFKPHAGALIRWNTGMVCLKPYSQIERLQDFPLDYNYQNEQHRFGQAGRLWKQAAEQGSEKWYAVIDELISLDFTIVPTMTIYEASRDLMRAMEAEWHDEYTLPSLWRFYTPSRKAHGSILVLLDYRRRNRMEEQL